MSKDELIQQIEDKLFKYLINIYPDFQVYHDEDNDTNYFNVNKNDIINGNLDTTEYFEFLKQLCNNDFNELKELTNKHVYIRVRTKEQDELCNSCYYKQINSFSSVCKVCKDHGNLYYEKV